MSPWTSREVEEQKAIWTFKHECRESGLWVATQ